MNCEDKIEIGYLIDRCALNDQRAFGVLYQKCSPTLYGLLINFTKDKEESSDLLQKVFEKIWLNAKHISAEVTQPWAWMCQITRNLAIDHLRASQRNIVRTQEEIPDLQDDKSYFSYEPKLQGCINDLSEDQSKTIMLIYQFGLSQAQIAKKLDEPLGTVKSWARRAMARLKLCLS